MNDQAPSSGALYADFMTEIRQRLTYLRELLVEVANEEAADRHLKAETCFLQVRMICELIALASLCANEQFGLTKDLMKKWHAREIFSGLEQINPYCFPRAAKIVRTPGGLHIEIGESAISREDLTKIYDQCGAKLHRGMLKHALKGDARLYDLTEVNRWAASIIELLNCHVSLIPHGNRVLLVQLFGENGKVTVATAEGEDGDSFAVAEAAPSSAQAEAGPPI